MREREALEKAKEELALANWLSECGANAGIRRMWSNKTYWLSWVVYLAERELERSENGT